MQTADFIDALDAILTEVASGQVRKLVLGLSGGLDSMVLLALLSQWRQQQPDRQLQAVYIHHGLSPNADAWAAFCAEQCQQRQVPFQTIRVTLQGDDNLEQKARDARYKALATLVTTADTALCTAHHADDQLESLLLALKRGSGLAGLAGIAKHKAFAGGWLVRPLLSFTRVQIQAFATSIQLAWIEDESNQNLRFDRNYLRQQVLPQLTQRWPSFALTASRSIGQLAQAAQAQQLLLAPLLQGIATGQQLDIHALLQQPLALQPLLLRQWLAEFELNPSADRLDKIQQQLIRARVDACPEIMVAGWALRRFQQQLYLLTPLELQQLQQPLFDQALPFGVLCTLSDGSSACWDFSPQSWGETAQYIPLAVPPTTPLRLEHAKLSLRFKPAGAQHSKALKDWCKSWHIAPWQRSRLMLFCALQQLEAVVLPATPQTGTLQTYRQTETATAQSWLSILPVQALAKAD